MREYAEKPQAVAQARAWLRNWLRTEDRYAFERLGQDVIRAAADATARLAGAAEGSSSEPVLREIEAAAASLDPQPAARRWWLPGRVEPALAPSSDGFAPLVDRLDRARDSVTRRLIVLQTDRTRFIDADRTLGEALDLLRALGPAIEAAAREVRGENPARAATLADHAATTLPERERAVLTQVAVTRQALLTLDLLIANQTTLESALEQARTATLSALQVALAARRATAEGAALAAQSAALARTSEAANAPEQTGAAHARRMLDDAIAQARAAIAASQSPRPD